MRFSRVFTLLLFLFAAPLAAENVSVDHKVRLEPPLLSTQTPKLPDVNLVTGELSVQALDLLVEGVVPLTFRRFYNHQFGKWRFNPETELYANFEYANQPTFISIGQESGGVLLLEKATPTLFRFNAKQPGYFHEGGGALHPENLLVSYTKLIDPKNPLRFDWRGEIIDGSGSVRTFTSGMHTWHAKVLEKEKKNIYTTWSHYHHPESWIPYQLRIEEVRLSSGNKICCEYTELESNEKLPNKGYLSKLTAYNHNKSKCLGHLSVNYHTKEKKKQIALYAKERTLVEISGMEVMGSDGRSVCYSFGKNESLQSVKKADGSEERFYYDPQGRLIRIDKPGGFYLKVIYDKENRVSALLSPTGPQGEEVVCSSYLYGENETTVTYSPHLKKTYHFDSYKKVSKVDTYLDNTLHSCLVQKWDATSGHLLESSITDAKGRVLQTSSYEYDKFHNITNICCEKERVQKEYSQEGLNLLVKEISPSGRQTCYTYFPHTNLLSSEIVYDGDKALLRTLYFYDDMAALVKKVVDDGSSESAVRLVYEMAPKSTFPCVGLPECMKQMFTDSEGEEQLLHTTCYSYTPAGQIARQSHYDATGKLCYTLQNRYKNEQLVERIGPMGERICYDYDAAHNPILCQGPHPESFIETRYDLAHRPVMEIRGGVLITEKEYDSSGNLLCSIDEAGRKSHYLYDGLNRLIAITHPDGGVEQFSYDILGNLLDHLLPNGDRIKSCYDSLGRVTEAHHPDGSFELFSYYPGGNLAQKREISGAKTLYTYDAFDNVIRQQCYSKNVLLKSVERKYSFYGPLFEINPEGVETQFYYDRAGRKIKEVCCDKQLHFGYDALGRLTETRYDDYIIASTFDASGRLLQSCQRDLYGKPTKQLDFAYDEAGNKTEVKSCSGTSYYTYDCEGRLVCEIDPLGGKKSYFYEGDKITMVDARGVMLQTTTDFRKNPCKICYYSPSDELIHQTENSYDLMGLLIQRKEYVFNDKSPSKQEIFSWQRGVGGRVEKEIFFNHVIQTLYDEQGRVHTTIKPNGERLYRQYDGLGRVVRFYGPDFDYEYSYDRCDRVVAAFDRKNGQRTVRCYDPHGNLLSETLGNNLTLHSYYNPQGQRTHLLLPDGSGIDYCYLAGSLFKVFRKEYETTYASRNLDGQPTAIFLPKRLGTVTFCRNGRGEVERISSPFGVERLTYDLAGNLLSCGSHCYEYDDLGQLRKCDESCYKFNSLAQVLSATAAAAHYDAAGNIQTDGTHFYTYDSLDRLSSVTTATGTVSYDYDPFNRRISKHHIDRTEHFLWDRENEIGLVEEGRIKELRVLGEESFAEIGAAVCLELEGKSYLPLHDFRGSLRHLIDLDSLQLVQSFDLPPFGPTEPLDSLSPWLYFSKRLDEESGLVYFGRRYYNPKLGHWMSADPSGLIDGSNCYAFVHNNPLTQLDLYGLYTLSQALKPLFWGVQKIGEHLIPLPGIRDTIEAIGRWGCGGNFSDLASYHKNYSRIHKIKGKANHHTTKTFNNGILTTFEQALQHAQFTSEVEAGDEVYLLYKGTQGLLMDLLDCAIGKLGFKTPYDQMCASFYKSVLHENSKHRIQSLSHSGGGIHMMNIGRLLTPEQRTQIFARTCGSATLIPKGFFGGVENFVSAADFIPLLSDPFTFLKAAFMHDDHVKIFKAPLSAIFTDHYFSSPTYKSILSKSSRGTY